MFAPSNSGARLARLFVFYLLLACAACASTWRSSLYPENWQPPGSSTAFSTASFLQDFSFAGYRRGEVAIPEVAGPIFNVVTGYGADPSGVADSTTAIQNAINAAGATSGGGVVFLPAGTYRIAPKGASIQALNINRSNVVLRGAGTGQTFLLNTSYLMRGKSVIRVAPSSTTDGAAVAITADLNGPTRRIPVANASAFARFDFVRIEWTFTTQWIAEHGQQNYWSETDRPENARYLRQVTATNPAEGWIEVDIPTRYTIKTRDGAVVRKVTGLLTNVGVEALSMGNVQHPGTNWGEEDYSDPVKSAYDVHGSQLLRFQDVRDAWIRSIHSFQPAGNTTTSHLLSNGIIVLRSFRVTVRDCQFRRPQYGGGGGNGYLYHVMSSNDNLLLSNVAEFSRHGFSISRASSTGNVFRLCEDRETQRATGHTGSYTTSGSGSDNHMHFSHSNLWDQCSAHNSFWTAHHRQFSGSTPHGLSSAHGVFWNTSGSGTRGSQVVRSEQARYGYVIGTSGARNTVANPTGGGTAPADIVQGVNQGATLQPQSLYLDQLARRLTPAVIYSANGATGGSAPVDALSPYAPAATVTVLGPGSLVRTGNVFTGWNTAPAGTGTRYAPGATLSLDRTTYLYAQWTPTLHAVTFDPQGGAAVSPALINVQFGQAYGALPTPARTGFEFSGWFTAPTGGTLITSASIVAIDTDHTLHARWTPLIRIYPATFDSQGGAATVPDSKSVEFGTPYGVLPVPSRPGFVFISWFTAPTGGSPVTADTVVTAVTAHTLYARWSSPPLVQAGTDRAAPLDTPVPWQPAELQPAAWYDAADESSLVLEDDAVARWSDRSGHQNHAVQNTPDLRPVTGQHTIGELPTVSLRVGDGTARQFLSAPNAPSLNLDAAGGANLFAVFRYVGFVVNGTSTINAPLSKGAILIADPSYGIRVGSTNALAYKSGTNVLPGTTNFVGQNLLLSGTTDQATRTGSLFVQGIFRTSHTATAAIASDNTSPLYFGRDSGTSRYTDVDFGEVLLLGGPLSAATRQRIEGYLAHKWSLAAQLPDDHPHKTAAPVRRLAYLALGGSAFSPDGASLTHAWSVLSGPGPVLFSDPAALDCTAIFETAGAYTLRLTSTDGFSTGFDDIAVQISAFTPLTPFRIWRGAADDATARAAFSTDTNADGVPDGLAWLLGAASPDATASTLLPTLAPAPDALAFTFRLLPPSARGGAGVTIDYSADLASWTRLPIPAATGTHDGVDFAITSDEDLVEVRATLPLALFGDGARAFVRLRGELPAP